MSKNICNRSSRQTVSRLSFEELGICKERYLELRNGCAEGKYSSEILSKACTGLEFIKSWIILSVTKNKSYDRIEYDLKLGHIPVGRTDFYGFRRRFYHNLDCLLRTEKNNASSKRKGWTMNSRQKGASGERELSHILREHGYSCRRGQQYCGANGDADVVGLPGVHIECKRVERLNISEAMKQAVRDVDSTEVPAVFHRKNREGWLVTMRLEDWIKMYAGSRRGI